MKIYFANMNHLCCIFVVKYELERMGFPDAIVRMGEAEIKTDFSFEQFKQLSDALAKHQVFVIFDKDRFLIEKIKTVLYNDVYRPEGTENITISVLVNKIFNQDSRHLGYLFFKYEKITMKSYSIDLKIYRIKSLILRDILDAEIAATMNYSSVPAMCEQFFNETGEYPDVFRKKAKENQTPVYFCKKYNSFCKNCN